MGILIEKGDKIARTTDDKWIFYCPGCEGHHGVNDTWGFNGDKKKPTFSPSILVKGTVPITDEEYEKLMRGEKIEPKKLICHSFVCEGKIQFLSDCTHKLASQTIELPDMD